MYIRIKISKLYEGVAKNVSTPVSYHNIAFIEPIRSSLEIT